MSRTATIPLPSLRGMSSPTAQRYALRQCYGKSTPISMPFDALEHRARPASCTRNDEALVIHRNTLRHRIERYEQITGSDFNDMEQVVAMWWAFRRLEVSSRTLGLPRR